MRPRTVYPSIRKTILDFLPDELLLKILNYVSLPDLANKLWRSLGNRRLRRICEDREICKSITVDAVWDKDTAKAVVCMAGQRLEELTVAVKKREDYYFIINEDIASKDSKWMMQGHLLDRVESDSMLSMLLSIIDECGDKITLRKLTLKTKLTTQRRPTCCPLSNTLLANASSTLKHLTWIDVKSAKLFVNDDHAWVKAVADNCLHLEHAELPDLFRLTDEIFNYFLERVQGTLKHLALDCCKLTDNSYRNLKHCIHLEELMAGVARHIKEEGLRTILELPNLRQLYISHVYDLTAADLVKVLDGKVMPKIIFLEMAYMGTSIDDNTLKMLSMSCPNLLAFFLYNGCEKIGEVEIRSVLERCKQLVIFFVYDYELKLSKIPQPVDGFYFIWKCRLKTNYCYRSKVITREARKKVTPLHRRELQTASMQKFLIWKPEANLLQGKSENKELQTASLQPHVRNSVTQTDQSLAGLLLGLLWKILRKVFQLIWSYVR